ncbi:MAG: PAS domain S-box protein [Rubrobacteraceae bacterium]
MTARKEAEETLKENEERFRALADNISQLAWMADENGWIFWYNKRWFDYTRTTLEEMRGWGWKKVHHPDHRNYRWFLSRATPIRDGSGRVVRWFGTNTDVTEHKLAEERTRFLSDLNLALQPLTDPDEITATTARMLGDHLLADRCAYAEVEEDEDHFAMSGFGAEALRLMRQNEPYVVDSEEDKRVGEADLAAYRMTRIRAVACVPLHKGGRFVAGMAVHQKTPRRWTPEEVEIIATVVSRCWESLERARTVRRLRESEKRYRTLAAASTSIVWTMDPDGGFVEAQPSWEEYTGQGWEEHRGFGRVRAIHPNDRARIQDAWEMARSTHELYASDGRLWHAPSGAYRHFIARSLPLLDGEGDPREWVGMIADVEDLRRAEAEMRRLNHRLEVLERIKKDPNLKTIPVVMLTSSREEQDLIRSYDLGVNAYVVKPVEFARFVEAVREIGLFWAVLNQPPPGVESRE